MYHWLAMGGYGQFVWSAYAIGLAVFAGNILITQLKKRQTKKAVQRYLKKQAHHASHS